LARASGDKFKEPFSDTTAYLEAAVPKDQRPVNELKQLKDDLLYSWVRQGPFHVSSCVVEPMEYP